jgi:hypothetical protein
MPKRFVISVVAFALLAAIPAAVLAATITQILGNHSAYDGKHVDVSGTVEHLEQKTSHKGNLYVTFSLCSSQCIRVFGFGSPNISDAHIGRLCFGAGGHAAIYLSSSR